VDKWDGVAGFVTYPLLTSKHFLLNTLHTQAHPSVGLLREWGGKGWGRVGRGERELSFTFDHVTLFPPPLPLLIVSRLLACMQAYMNVRM